jgi:hypothetical protein
VLRKGGGTGAQRRRGRPARRDRHGCLADQRMIGAASG